MSVRVLVGQVNNGIRMFKKGEFMTGLSTEDEARLVSLGVAEIIPEVKTAIEDNPYVGKTAEEIIAIVALMDNKDELKAILKIEQQSKKRKTVIQAIEAKLESISRDDPDHDEEDSNGQNEKDAEISFNPDEVIK